MNFTILGKPQAKQRPRFSKGHTYTPKKTIDYENYVRECYRSSGGVYQVGALKMAIRVVYKVPSSLKIGDRTKYRQGLLHCTKRPDLDNLAKSVMDSLNQLAYKDDSQIVELLISKEYGEEDFVVVSLEQKE